MSEIQRRELRNGFRGEDAYKHEDGPYVWYMDHLRAVTLAKIEVLEEECDASDAEDIEFADPSVQRYAIRREQWRESRIATLRKELKG